MYIVNTSSITRQNDISVMNINITLRISIGIIYVNYYYYCKSSVTHVSCYCALDDRSSCVHRCRRELQTVFSIL